MEPNGAAKPPVLFWIVAIVSLLWNAYGGFDYTMTQLRSDWYLTVISKQMGMSVAEMNTFFDSFPAWASVLWAVGVWGSVAGSVLLLARSRYAVTAFIVSLVGAVLSFGYQFTIDLPPALADSMMGKVMPFIIVGAIVLQWWYASRMRAAGVLR